MLATDGDAFSCRVRLGPVRFSLKQKKLTYYGLPRVSSGQIKIDKAPFIC